MHFKKLEIVGFKSFLNKTKLKFEPGVTAVVGPNGCGKSNIVDAIKWVLGEQSVKSMRSSAMQDVIFNGTDKFDPVNIAEVSLTLSNEDKILPVDYDEVTISRKLYRSGESEYLINKLPVRLADVRNLLMGTGMGTSSYSVVEQGRMDMILSSKPEERRYVFEEASGITRYKSKKREALLKLERTQENLVRINDIVREVERQIKSIERQARKAERYKARYDELKGLEVKLAYKKHKELDANNVSLGAEGGELKQVSETLIAQLEEKTVSLTRLRTEFNETFEGLQKIQNEVMTISSDIDKNKHVSDVDAERIQELQKFIERLEWEISDAVERKKTLEDRLETLQIRFNKISGKCREKDSERAAFEEKVKSFSDSVERHNHDLKFNREKVVDMADQQTKTKNTLIKLNADTQNARSREKRLKLERHSVQTEKDKISEEVSRVKARIETVNNELEEKKREHNIFNERYISKQQELSAANNDKREKEKRLHEIKPRRLFLEKLISEREGINNGVKAIMDCVEKQDTRFSGVHGILSELVNVPDNYEESIESILGDASQALIVDNREVADKVIGYLSENSIESVNIIILDELKKIISVESFKESANGILNDISHILIAGEPYRTALHTLLNDTFVTVSTESVRMFIDGNSDFMGRIIGEKGEIYQKGIHRSKNYSDREVIPLFGRQEKAKEMLEEEDQLTAEIERGTANIVGIEKWLKDSEIEKHILEKELREKRIEFADISSKRMMIDDKFSSLAEELLLLDTEIEEETAAIKELQDEGVQLEVRVKEQEGESHKVQMVIEESQRIIQDNSRERESALFQLSDVKADLSALVKEEENLLENLERDKDLSQRMETLIQEKHDRIAESSQRITAFNEERKELEERNVEFVAILEEKDKEISERKQCKDTLSQRIQQEAEQVKKQEQELESFRDKIRDLDIKKKELEYKSAALAERMRDAYKVDITNMDLTAEEDTDWAEIVNRIEGLKTQLERMGEVSLGAVEEHKQLEERFQFLSTQHADLAKSRETLLNTITRINRTTRKLFMETFESIRKEFNEYFRMLFNGGKADLELQDESDVLECGIDIIVCPPGKKLHNILQLSGGEKAMTAIALIFAIFKVNPSPFCILDEIDAPLDESNIVRFCNVLREFLKLSQFIIVTHNRMTIQLADVLYGITMEEKGVSKIVSVKFAEEKETLDKETIPAAV